MKRLHELLGDLTNTSADIENLGTVLRIVEWADGTGEEELRAAVNMAIFYLNALKEGTDLRVNMLDEFLLEQWHANSVTRSNVTGD